MLTPILLAHLLLTAPHSDAWISTSGPDETLDVDLETSVLWPVFPGLFFQLRTALPATDSAQIIVGAQWKLPEDRADEGEFSHVDATLGWRQYLWKGLHVDGLAAVGWGRLRDSTLDGRDYDSLDVELSALLGYRIDLRDVYVLLQPVGIAGVVYRSNPWPIRGEGTPRTEGPIYMGNVLVGLHF